MPDDYVEKIAGELADLALADERRSEDERIVIDISEIVGASSQTLQEAFLTAVRVRRAERRARQLLADRAAEQMSSGPMISDNRNDDDYEEHRQRRTTFERERPDQEPEAEATEPDDAIDAALEDALNMMSEADDTDESKITPSRAKRR